METYISTIIPGVHRLGHTLAFWSELNQPADREPVPLPDGAPAWCVSEVGVQAALAALREWHPDLIYSHGERSGSLPPYFVRSPTMAPASAALRRSNSLWSRPVVGGLVGSA